MTKITISISDESTPVNNRDSIQAPDEVVVYHWDRIIGAGVIFLLVLGFSISAISSLLQEETEEIIQDAMQESQQPEQQETLETELVVEKTLIPATENKELDNAIVEQPQASNLADEAVTQEPEIKAEAVVELEPKPVLEEKAETLSEETALISEAKKSAEENSEKTGPLFSEIKTQVYSDAIKSFVLANGVINKVPVGTIDDIRLDHNKIATVYAHSEAIGLRNESLHYVWSLNGKRIAKVRSGVWSNYWRSYSSKFINGEMRGDWKIELTDSKGDVLAASEFRY